MAVKLTRQGVRDLSNPGHRNQTQPDRRHVHLFHGPMVVVGWKSPDGYDFEATPIYARTCLVCGELEPC